MWCPLCGAEYREGFTACSDCQVALVSHPPGEALADAATPEASFALLWSGNDARIHAEICGALNGQQIPARTLRRDDHLFGPTMRPEFEVYVPASLMGAAREALHQADPTDGDSEQISDSQQLLDSSILEIPAEDGPPDENDYYQEEEDRGDLQNLDPLDATVEIWSGQDADIATMITSSLRENGIPFRRDPDLSDPDIAEPYKTLDEPPVRVILVFPEHAKRAKAIVREIIDATPPE